MQITEILIKNCNFLTFDSNISFLENLINNNKLVHYSLASKGSALYYQKIMINRIYRMRMHNIKSTINNSKYKPRLIDNATITLGGEFQHKYLMLSEVYKIKKNIITNFFGNDKNAIGTFKNNTYNRT
jgi:hypothetical protein